MLNSKIALALTLLASAPAFAMSPVSETVVTCKDKRTQLVVYLEGPDSYSIEASINTGKSNEQGFRLWAKRKSFECPKGAACDSGGEYFVGDTSDQGEKARLDIVTSFLSRNDHKASYSITLSNGTKVEGSCKYKFAEK